MSLGSQVGLPTGSHVGLAHPLASCGFPRLFLCWLPCAFPSKFSQWLAHWFRHWFLNCFPQWFLPLAAPLPPRWFPHWFLHWLANRAQPNPIERNQTPIESIRFNRVQSIIILNRIHSNPPSPINIDQSTACHTSLYSPGSKVNHRTSINYPSATLTKGCII